MEIMSKPKFTIGKQYKSTQGQQIVTCIGVTSGGLPYFEWPSGSHGGVSERAIDNWKEVKPMTKFKAGDVVTSPTVKTQELTVESVDGNRVWFTNGTWRLESECTLVRPGNATFVVGQKYIDSAKNVMIVLAQSPSDPERFYIEYVSKPHVSGSVFLKEAYKWTVYHEPKKVARYINAYSDGTSCGYTTREAADKAAGTKRIACKRIEFTEGEFDE